MVHSFTYFVHQESLLASSLKSKEMQSIAWFDITFSLIIPLWGMEYVVEDIGRWRNIEGDMALALNL